MNTLAELPIEAIGHDDLMPVTDPARRADSGQDDDVVHIVGNVQHWLDRLGLAVPRALCGELLVADPDRPDCSEFAPVCPRCAELAGWSR